MRLNNKKTRRINPTWHATTENPAPFFGFLDSLFHGGEDDMPVTTMALEPQKPFVNNFMIRTISR